MNRKLLLSLLAISALLVVWFVWVTRPACSQACQSVSFVIQRGESSGSVSQRLEKAGLIRSSLAFQLILTYQGLGNKIQAGSFTLNPEMPPSKIATALSHGRFDIKITIPEGLRREEVAARLTKELGGNPDSQFNSPEFLRLTAEMEGQLFPDTYFFASNVDAKKVVEVMQATYQKKTANLAVTPKVLVLASLVEREVRNDDDRPVVAGILSKRLEQGWPLQVDATVQYAVGSQRCQVSQRVKPECDWWPKNLTKNDLAIASPYNTYLHNQLPPGPITNPGLAALKAAVSPQKTNYWYYLSDDNGQVHYSATLAEHQANIRKYLLGQ